MIPANAAPPAKGPTISVLEGNLMYVQSVARSAKIKRVNQNQNAHPQILLRFAIFCEENTKRKMPEGETPEQTRRIIRMPTIRLACIKPNGRQHKPLVRQNGERPMTREGTPYPEEEEIKRKFVCCLRS